MSVTVPVFNVSGGAEAQVLPVAGRLSRFHVMLGGQAGGDGGSGHRFTVLRATTLSQVERTEVTCTILGTIPQSGEAATRCADLVHAALFAAGEVLMVLAEPVGATPQVEGMAWTTAFEPLP